MYAVILASFLGGEGRFFEGRELRFWESVGRESRVEPLWPDSPAPGPARRLLEEPTRENARLYLDWQDERLRRLNQAMAALDEARKASEILYFARPGCRFCERQERELGGLPVTRVPEGSPLWSEHDVKVTPTFIVRGKKYEGLTPRDVLAGRPGRE